MLHLAGSRVSHTQPPLTHGPQTHPAAGFQQVRGAEAAGAPVLAEYVPSTFARML